MPTQFGRVGKALGATETTETSLGDIDVPVDASRITGISAACALETGTATEGPIGHARLDFAKAQQLEGIPIDITGIVDVVGSGYYQPEMIPVNIPVTPKAKIHCFMTLTKDQTGGCYGQICLRFE